MVQANDADKHKADASGGAAEAGHELSDAGKVHKAAKQSSGEAEVQIEQTEGKDAETRAPAAGLAARERKGGGEEDAQEDDEEGGEDVSDSSGAED